jgi:hypothetical protein
MQFHPDFIRRSFEMNTASILTALLPVIASKANDEADLAAGVRSYLEQYGQALSKLSERDLTVALARAAQAMQAADKAAGE